MGKLGESPKDRIYSECEKMGFSQVSNLIQEKNFNHFSSGDEKYVIAWFNKENLEKERELRLKSCQTVSIICAIISTVAAILTIIFTLIGKP